MFKEKKHKIFVCFSCFNPLDRQPVAFKTLEHTINYNPSHRPGEERGKMRFQQPYTRFVCSITSLMTFKAFLYVLQKGELIFINATNNFSIFQKKNYVARKIMCFVMIIIIARQNFFSPSYLLILFSYHQDMF